MEFGPYTDHIPLVLGMILEISGYTYHNAEWFVGGNLLTDEEVEIAKRIMKGVEKNLPLYINPPALKYFSIKALSNDPEFDPAFYKYA